MPACEPARGSGSAPLSPAGLLALQRTAGNAATARVLAREVGTLDSAEAFLLDMVGGRPELITETLKGLYRDFGPRRLRQVQWLREDRQTSFADANRIESLVRYLDTAAEKAESEAVGAVRVPQSQLKKRKGPQYTLLGQVKTAQEKIRNEAIDAAETARAANVGPYTEKAFAPIVTATETVVPTTVTWLRQRTSDEGVAATLGRVMTIKPGEEGEKLAEGVLARPAEKQRAVAGKLEGLIGKVGGPTSSRRRRSWPTTTSPTRCAGSRPTAACPTSPSAPRWTTCAGCARRWPPPSTCSRSSS